MASENESNVDKSELETQFEARSDDDEQLWEVIAITGQRGKKYRVRWAGFDPKTGKPWAQSWVDKHDCTDDLVEDWKAKQAKKKALEKKQANGARTSNASVSSRLSSGSSTRRLTRSSATIANPPMERAEAGPSRLSTTDDPRKSKRRRKSRSPSVESVNEDDETAVVEDRPRKRRKTGVEVVILPWTGTGGEHTGMESRPPVDGEDDDHDSADDALEYGPSNPAIVPSDKVGPPRDIKKNRLRKSTKSRKQSEHSEIHTSHAKQPSAQMDNVDEPQEAPGKAIEIVEHDVLWSADAEGELDDEIPYTPPVRLRTPVLSPRALARLELFDRMIMSAEVELLDSDVEEPVSRKSDSRLAFDSSRSAIVPETQTQSSTDQPQPPTPSLVRSPDPAPIVNYYSRSDDTNAAFTRQANGKETVFSTAPSTDVALAIPKKPLHPIPQISPSTFRAHLPLLKPPVNHKDHEEPPMSSIESFESPNRLSGSRCRNNLIDSPSSDIDETNRGVVTDTEIRNRGQELFQQHTQRQKESLRGRGGPRTRKQPLVEVVHAGANVRVGAKERITPVGVQFGDLGEEFFMSINETSHIDSAIGHGNADGERDRRIDQRQEEEESTQEALAYASSAHGIFNGRNDVARQDEDNTDFQPDPRPLIIGDAANTRSQTEPPTRSLGEALNLLNVKSEEMQRLELALTDERSTRIKLQEQLDVLNDLDNERLQWRVERATWDAEHDDTTAAVVTLTASTDALKKQIASAETDRDFFRDQYSQASSYVSSVRAENAELEQRVTIAEGQARDGVAMYKGLFEAQIKALKDDVNRWKSISELLQEKDRRTNDEIRRRAAEEPELREQCERLQEDLDLCDNAYRKLSGVHRKGKAQRYKQEKKIMKLRKEKCTLQTKLDNFGDVIKKGLGRSFDPDFPYTSTVALREEEDEDEDMYTCKWRSNGGEEQCPYSFDCIEDMERHLFSAGHVSESVGLRPAT